METTKKWQIAIIVCLAVALIACLFWVRSLSEKIASLEFDYQSLSYNVGRLTDNQNMLEAELDEMIREVNSLTEELDYTIIGAGTQPNTAAYQVTLIPKELAKNTKVEITVGDTTVPFTRTGDTFTGVVDIPLFEENEEHPVLTVTSAGITKKDVLEEIDLWYAYYDCLPDLFQSMNGIGSSNEDPERISLLLGYAFRLNDSYTDNPVCFTKITMTKTVNGEEGPCQDVTDRFVDYGDYAEFKLPDIVVNSTDAVTVVIRAEDSLGYIHELITHREEHDGFTVESGDETARIYGPDGTVLYTSPFVDLT